MIATTTGMLVYNREVLIKILRAKVIADGKVLGDVGSLGLSFAMPCGHTFHARSSADIPFKSVMCPCGQHWMIYYQEEYEKVHVN